MSETQHPGQPCSKCGGSGEMLSLHVRVKLSTCRYCQGTGIDQEWPRCAATVLLRDDRWGGFTDRCELIDGHEGSHIHEMGATEPLARMVWEGSHADA